MVNLGIQFSPELNYVTSGPINCYDDALDNEKEGRLKFQLRLKRIQFSPGWNDASQDFTDTAAETFGGLATSVGSNINILF